MSESGPNGDITALFGHVRFAPDSDRTCDITDVSDVPLATKPQRSKTMPYSMTWSARERTAGGSVRPNALGDARSGDRGRRSTNRLNSQHEADIPARGFLLSLSSAKRTRPDGLCRYRF
jgi:hypothetical protein